MRRWVAGLLVATLLSGCATYESSRRARNVGAVVGLAGLAVTITGLVLYKRAEANRCTTDCAGPDELSGAELGAFGLGMVGIGLLTYGIAFGVAGMIGMAKHDPGKIAPATP